MVREVHRPKEQAVERKSLLGFVLGLGRAERLLIIRWIRR